MTALPASCWLTALECAPGAGQVEVSDLTGVLGFQKMKAMARQQRSHSIEFAARPFSANSRHHSINSSACEQW